VGGLNWERERQRQRQHRDISTARVAQRVEFSTPREREDFWRAWQDDSEAMKAAGYSVRKIDGKWIVWQTVG
jgi:hypothetical protein